MADNTIRRDDLRDVLQRASKTDDFKPKDAEIVHEPRGYRPWLNANVGVISRTGKSVFSANQILDDALADRGCDPPSFRRRFNDGDTAWRGFEEIRRAIVAMQ